MTTEPKVDEVRAVDLELEGLPRGLSVQVTNQVVYVRHDGPVPLEDSLASLQRIAEDPRIPPGWPIIVDLLQLTLAPPDTKDVRAFVDGVGVLKEQISGKFAVVTENKIIYGLARMISMLSEFHAIHLSVFHDLASAEQYVRGK